ncbi:hypothetical protein [Egbenema bharatensis]|uniref:hypothetical protein n=1 Tax=Egbenema bharatensis TaxID=3463334 RepID=UPI003A853065
MSQLHVWAVVRLLPNMQRVVVNRFRRRGDAENYLHILRRYTPDGNFIIVFDPSAENRNLESQEFQSASQDCVSKPRSPQS